MKVHIEGNLYLESDSLQFIIKEYNGKTDKNGNALYKTHGYFNSVQNAMHHLVKMKIMQSTATTLKELIASVDDIRKFIEERVSA